MIVDLARRTVTATPPQIEAPLDVSELLRDIVATAPNFENNSKYLARMSQIIRELVLIKFSWVNLDTRVSFRIN